MSNVASASVVRLSVPPSVRPNIANGLSLLGPPSAIPAAPQQAAQQRSEREATSEATKITRAAARPRTPTAGGEVKKGRKENGSICSRSEVAGNRIVFFFYAGSADLFDIISGKFNHAMDKI